jgi:plasmid maintenance system antidote protein VapI
MALAAQKTHMPIRKITALPGASLRIELDNRGWNVRLLSERWAMTRRRVEQIIKADERPCYLDDAIKGLPQYLAVPSVEVLPLAPSSQEDYIAAFSRKGWTSQMLAQRWGLTRRRVDQIFANSHRPSYYDDAITGLPQILR